MAKRKKTTKHRPHRRRRMSGVGAGLGHDAMEAVGLVAGSVLATVAQRQLTTMSPKLVAGAEVIAGIMLKRHANSPFMSGVGWGVMGAGAIGIAHDFHVIAGVEDFVNGISGGGTYETDMRGLGNESYVAGLHNSAYVSGAGEKFDFVNEM